MNVLPNTPWGLTPREVDVMEGLLAYGHAKVVAGKLGLSDKTVHSHTESARKRMGQRTTLQAVVQYALWQRAEYTDRANNALLNNLRRAASQHKGA